MSVGIKIQKAAKSAPLDLEIETLRDLKAKAEAAQLLFEEQQERVVKTFEAQGRKTMKSGTVKATLVERSLTRYDERGLAKALGAPVWNKVTKRVLDKPKLEDAVDKGEVDINVVAQHATVVPSKPHIRFSAVTPDDDE